MEIINVSMLLDGGSFIIEVIKDNNRRFFLLDRELRSKTYNQFFEVDGITKKNKIIVNDNNLIIEIANSLKKYKTNYHKKIIEFIIDNFGT